MVRFTIGVSGEVVAAELAETTLPAPEVSECIVLAVKRWVFPGPATGKPAVIYYPFVREPG